MPGQIGTSIRANTRRIYSGDRESDAIDAAGLAQARERFALLGRDVSQLSDDQLRNLLSELERRFRDEGLTNAICARRIDHRKTASTSISFGFDGPCRLRLAVQPISVAHRCRQFQRRHVCREPMIGAMYSLLLLHSRPPETVNLPVDKFALVRRQIRLFTGGGTCDG
jgi:hypothetical protein